MRVAVTQRVVQGHGGERRDALDQRWVDTLLAIGAWPLFVPNHEAYASAMFDELEIDALLLTGGDSLAEYGGVTPERDRVERALLRSAISRGLPVVGVCRGMQVIQDAFGAALERVDGHVATRHRLEVNAASRFAAELAGLDTVNAFHELGARGAADPLLVAATSADGVVMAVEHRELPLFGQMWHPEREPQPARAQLALLDHALRAARPSVR